MLIAMVEQRQLEKYGYAVTTAKSGDRAVAAIEKAGDIDLVLMDINPGEGIDVTEAASRILARRDHPPAGNTSSRSPKCICWKDSESSSKRRNPCPITRKEQSF